MGTEARARDADLTGAPKAPSPNAFAPGAGVVLLRPRRLRGTFGTVQRRLASGWEVEIRTPLGTPLHLTVPERGLRLR